LREELQKSSRGSEKKTKTVPSVGLGPNPPLGSGDARVAVVEFSDYECPFCRRHATQTLPKLITKYVDSGQLKYYIRDFPLNFHSNAKVASIAAACAGDQGNYWGMHTALFANDRQLSKDYYLQTATNLELDVPAFEDCLTDPARTETLNREMEAATKLGVRGSPAFFIGRLDGDRIVDAVAISGARSYSVFAKEVDLLLR
jgi:protein-disulfide isomerase